MKYMGSKNRHAKELLPIILKDRKENQWYVEPFCGGCNMIDKVGGNRIANDIHYYLIEMWKSLQSGWVPPHEVSNEDYCKIRDNKNNYLPELVGFVGFCCTYSGKWFGGYARGNTDRGIPRNYCLESKNNLLNQLDGIKGIIFHNKNYWELEIPDNSIVYCDPPYGGTTKYKDSFNNDKFWKWAEEMGRIGHKVFVSEYNVPDNWVSVWEKQVFNSLTKETGSKVGVEKLFILRR